LPTGSGNSLRLAIIPERGISWNQKAGLIDEEKHLIKSNIIYRRKKNWQTKNRAKFPQLDKRQQKKKKTSFSDNKVGEICPAEESGLIVLFSASATPPPYIQAPQ
jgi:hypothetical protein